MSLFLVMLRYKNLQDVIVFSDDYNSKITYEVLRKVFNRGRKTYSKFYIRRTKISNRFEIKHSYLQNYFGSNPLTFEPYTISYIWPFSGNFWQWSLVLFSPDQDWSKMLLWDNQNEPEQLLIRAKILSSEIDEDEVVFSTVDIPSDTPRTVTDS
jgi:hypothetical protein